MRHRHNDDWGPREHRLIAESDTIDPRGIDVKVFQKPPLDWPG
jgi:hypothetical protein